MLLDLPIKFHVRYAIMDWQGILQLMIEKKLEKGFY